jgi:hypothetical protein
VQTSVTVVNRRHGIATSGLFDATRSLGFAILSPPLRFFQDNSLSYFCNPVAIGRGMSGWLRGPHPTQEGIIAASGHPDTLRPEAALQLRRFQANP